jgi:NAD-dependent SIR2 family protein deacetylase
MKQAWILSMKNRRHVTTSKTCGCYYCGHIFPPGDVKEWTDQGETALCPRCWVDAVLADSQQVRIEPDVLRKAHLYWFCNHADRNKWKR